MTAKGASPPWRSQDRLALESLLQVSRSLVESRDVATIARRTVDSLCGLLAAHHVALFRLDPESEDLIPIAVSGGGEGIHRGLSTLPKGMGLAAIALRERGPVVITDMVADPRVALPAEWRDRIEKAAIRSGLTVPLFVGDVAVGALAAVDRPGRTFTAEDIRLAQAFADLAGAALENARLLAAEQAAREAAEVSERRHRELVQGLDAVVWEADMADEPAAGPRRFTFVSEQAQALLGHPVARWLEEPGFWAGLIHPDDRERVVATCRAGADDLQIDYRVRAADGRVVWLRDVVRVSGGREGGAQRRRGVMIDITEARDAEVARHVAEERLAGLLAMAPEAVMAIDERQRILLFSQGAEEVFGYRAEEVLGRPLDMLLPVRFHAAHGAHVAAFGASQEISRPMGRRRAILGRRKNGEEFPAEASISKSMRNGEKTYSVILRDITERQRAEDALHEANQTLSAVIDASPAAIWMLDHEGRILLWNPAAEQVFGWSPAEVLGRPAPFVPEDGQPEFRELLARALQGRLSDVEVRRRRKDGALIDLSISTSPLRDAAGTVVGNVTVGVDITERKRLEEEIRQSQKMEAIGRLAGGIAHDFNNLLTVISGRAELVLARMAPDDPGQRSMELISKTAGRAAALTRQLLAFSRKQVLRRQLIDCNALITDMVAMLSRLIGVDVEVVTTLDPRLGRTHADPGQVEQVLLNLAINARDAMPGGGRLRIETANVEIGEAFARQHPGVTEGPHVMLAVSDTGSGMDAETRARIFEPFFTTKEPGKGTGLGLSTVYGVVQQHGGGIAVESAPGRGTTFRVYLPRAEGDVGSGEAPATEAGGARGEETVLLVEDEAEVRRLAREILEAHGYTVLEAAGPGEALRISEKREGPIHLLLTDLMMPEMNGYALAERLAAQRPSMSVIYMSGTTEDAVIRQRLEESDVGLLQKPFSPDALALAVRRALDVRRT